MYRKNIEHMIMVSLKYFFDLDYSFCNHALLMALVVMSLFKLFFTQIAGLFYDGIVTVKEDARTLKGELDIIKENWENSNLKETLTHNLRAFKNLIPQKIS